MQNTEKSRAFLLSMKLELYDTFCLYGFDMSIGVSLELYDTFCLYGFDMSIGVSLELYDTFCLYGFDMFIGVSLAFSSLYYRLIAYMSITFYQFVR